MRRPETVVPQGVEAVVADLLEPLSLDAALAGVDTRCQHNAVGDVIKYLSE